MIKQIWVLSRYINFKVIGGIGNSIVGNLGGKRMKYDSRKGRRVRNGRVLAESFTILTYICTWDRIDIH